VYQQALTVTETWITLICVEYDNAARSGVGNDYVATSLENRHFKSFREGILALFLTEFLTVFDPKLRPNLSNPWNGGVAQITNHN